MSAEHPSDPKSTDNQYILSGATVDGLSEGLKLKREYYFAITIDGKSPPWKSQEVKTKEKTIAWKLEETPYEFEGGESSNVEVKLYMIHALRRTEIGSVVRTLSSWMLATEPVPLLRKTSKKDEQFARVKLSIAQKRREIPVERIDLVKVAKEEAEAKVTAMHAVPVVDKATEASDKVNEPYDQTIAIAQAWEPLLERVDAFVTAMDALTSVHPYAKMAWTVLSAAYKVVKNQQQHDQNIQKLVEKMNSVYEFLSDAQELDNEDAQDMLSRLAIQTIDCGHFVSKYAKSPSFLVRLFKQIGSNVEDKINEYTDSLDGLLQEFQGRSVLRTEITTVRMLADLDHVGKGVETLVKDMQLQNIPYTDGAGYEPSKCCIPGTRTILLDDISAWASSDPDAPDTERVCLLIGPAGTGKSTIAHTIAGRFETLNQLAASFCFSTSDRATRKPASLFRNIALDLAAVYPAFKDALFKAVAGKKRSYFTTDDLQMQFKTFLVEPAQVLLVTGTILVMVDALDESGAIKDRRGLLSILFQEWKRLPPSFRLLITSREESDIVQFVRRAKLDGILVKQMPTIHGDIHLRSDVLTFVRHKLTEAEMLSVLPTDCDIALADRAEGIFQWAAVACDHITLPQIGSSEKSRYEHIITGEHKSLGELYKGVLWQVFRGDVSLLASFRDVMGLVLTAVEPLSMSSLRELAKSLRTPLPVDEYLPHLGALLSGVSEEDAAVRPLHSSFRELLQSLDDGGEYYIGTLHHHERLAEASLQVLHCELHFNMGDLKTSYPLNRDVKTDASDGLKSQINQHLLYSCKHWGYHLSECADCFEEQVQDLLQSLFSQKFLFWLDALSISEATKSAAPCLRIAMPRLQSLVDAVVAIIHDAIKFVQVFAPVLNDSAAHIYLSALSWTPTESAIAQTYCSKYRSIAQAASGGIARWPTFDVRISSHRGLVYSVAFSPDGTHIVSGSHDDTVRMWDAQTGQPIGDLLTGQNSSALSVACSPDGTLIAAGSYDHTIRIWDAETRQPIGDLLTGHSRAVSSIAFSSDGTRIVSSSQDGTIRIWDVRSGAPIGEPLIPQSISWIKSVAFSPDGTRIVSGSYDGTIRLWNACNGQAIGDPLVGHRPGDTTVAAFSPDGRYIASGSDDHTVQIWDPHTGEALGDLLTGHNGAVKSVAFSRDSRWLVSGSEDRTIRIWDVQNRHAIGDPLVGHKAEVSSVAFSPDGTRIVSGSSDCTVRIWDVRSVQAPEDVPIGHDDRVSSVAFSPDGTRIVSGSFDRTIRIWDAWNGKAVGRPLTGHTNKVMSVAFSPDSKRIVSGAGDSTVRIWDAQHGQAIGPPMAGHRDSWVTSVSYSPDGRRIVSRSWDSSIRIWDAHTGQAIGQPLTGYNFGPMAVAYSPDATRIAYGTMHNTICIWDPQSGKLLVDPLTGHDGLITALAFSPDGKWIGSTSNDRTVRIWNADKGQAVGQPLIGHDGVMSSVAFSADGTRIVSGSDDRTIRVWSTETEAVSSVERTTNSLQANSEESSSDSRSSMANSHTDSGRMPGGSSLCLSPEPAHQLRQPYESEDPTHSGIELDFETGWITGNGGRDNILWVPPEQIRSLYAGRLQLVIPGPTIYIDLSNFVHGPCWTDCRFPLEEQ